MPDHHFAGESAVADLAVLLGIAQQIIRIEDLVFCGKIRPHCAHGIHFFADPGGGGVNIPVFAHAGFGTVVIVLDIAQGGVDHVGVACNIFHSAGGGNVFAAFANNNAHLNRKTAREHILIAVEHHIAVLPHATGLRAFMALRVQIDEIALGVIAEERGAVLDKAPVNARARDRRFQADLIQRVKARLDQKQILLPRIIMDKALHLAKQFHAGLAHLQESLKILRPFLALADEARLGKLEVGRVAAKRRYHGLYVMRNDDALLFRARVDGKESPLFLTVHFERCKFHFLTLQFVLDF